MTTTLIMYDEPTSTRLVRLAIRLDMARSKRAALDAEIATLAARIKALRIKDDHRRFIEATRAAVDRETYLRIWAAADQLPVTRAPLAGKTELAK